MSKHQTTKVSRTVQWTCTECGTMLRCRDNPDTYTCTCGATAWSRQMAAVPPVVPKRVSLSQVVVWDPHTRRLYSTTDADVSVVRNGRCWQICLPEVE